MSLLVLLFLIISCFILEIDGKRKKKQPIPDLTDDEMYDLWVKIDKKGHELVKCQFTNFDDPYKPNTLYIEVRYDWAPEGAARFIELVRDKHFHGAALFRGLSDFLVQFGLASSHNQRRKWGHSSVNIKDDPPNDIPFNKGILSFAGSGPDSRNSQVFITLGRYVEHLGQKPWEVPFGRVLNKWLDNLDFIETKYGDKVSQKEIWQQGYEYLYENFPDLSYFLHCRIVGHLPHIDEVREKRAKESMRKKIDEQYRKMKQEEEAAKANGEEDKEEFHDEL